MPTPNIANEIQRFRERLLDLTNRNPLLNYRKSRRRTLEIVDELPDQIFKRLVTDGKPFKFDFREEEIDSALDASEVSSELRGDLTLPKNVGDKQPTKRHVDDRLQTNESEERLASVLKSIVREAKTAIEETGINYLHLALGFLQWNDSENSQRRIAAPLILVPVHIDRKFDGRSGRFVYSVVWTEEEVRWNLSLAKRIERDFGLRLPEFDQDSTPEGYFATVSQATRTRPNWAVAREALLGFFSFHKLQMYEDIASEYWQSSGKLEGDSLATQIILGRDLEHDAPVDSLYAGDYEIDGNELAESICLAQEADSSQHSALCDIAAGKSLVIEGPPGTGKSQTITNAIAMAMHRGQRVLFVAEKLAALEVVQRKLAKLGLGDLCLELHSDVATARRVFESLRDRLDQTFQPPIELDQRREEIAVQQSDISDYLVATEQLCKPYDEPLYELLWRVIEFRSRGVEPRRNINCDTNLDLTKFKQNIQILENFVIALAEFPDPTRSPWWSFQATKVNPNNCAPVDDSLAELQQLSSRMVEELSALLKFGGSIHEWHDVSQTIDLTALEGLSKTQLSTVAELEYLLDPNARKIANRFVDALDRSAHLRSEISDVFLCDMEEGVAKCTELKSLLEAPLAERFRGKRIDAIERYQVWLHTTFQAVEEIQQFADKLGELGHGPVRNLEEYDAALYRVRLFRHPIVADSTRLHEGLFLNSAVEECRRGVKQSQQLAKTEEAIDSAFHLASAPAAERIIQIAKSIRPHVDSWSRFFNSGYRSAVRELKTFWRPGIGKSPKHWVANLESLLGLQQAQDEFASDEKLSKLLGPMFDGHATDWDAVKSLMDWVATAKGIGLSALECIDLLRKRDAHGVEITGSNVSKASEILKAQFRGKESCSHLGLERSDIASVRFDVLQERMGHLDAFIKQLSFALADIRRSRIESVDDVFKLTAQVEELHSLTRFAEDRATLENAIGGWCDVAEADPQSLTEAIAWCKTLTETPLPPGVERKIVLDEPNASCGDMARRLAAYQDLLSSWRESREQLALYGKPEKKFLSFDRSLNSDFACLKQLFALREKIADLPAWAAFSKVIQRCQRAGLVGFASEVLTQNIAPECVSELYQATVLNLVAEKAIEDSGTLGDFSRQGIEAARTQFQQLDREITQLNRQKIAHEAAQASPPVGNARGRVAEFTEMGLIRHEIQKQQRHCRIRDLLARAGNSVQSLKPCFMMSPLSVAQYLAPGTAEFDLVVMDEASQIKPEDALGTILRAKQIVVVGDPKQLPPTSFFDRSADDVGDDEATQFDNSESILEATMKSFQPARRLRWHYRSEHENLIQFSNNRFYDDDLVVFPSPTANTGRLGVYFHYVEGASFSGGENLTEAQVVAGAVVKHVLECPSETLGVGTFNMKQSRLIEELIDKECEADSRVAKAVEAFKEQHESLFVKNLENLQGDERDVIFVSYTYGPDPQSGRVMNRFGPMNGAAGWRRLNVLITRARKRVEVFSSMRASQIAGGPDKSKGVNALKDYLEFASTGCLPDRGEFTGREPDSPFEIAVARVVSSMGLEAVPQVGVAGYFIDLGVRERDGNGDFVLGIECDGATYHSSKSARDRDRLREEVIRSRGWQLHRIWSTDWFLNQHHEEERLRKVLASSLPGSNNE